MSTARRCKIIPAKVVEVLDGAYVLDLPDGEQYKVEGNNLPVKRGSLIRFEKNSFLRLANDVEVGENHVELAEESIETESDYKPEGNQLNAEESGSNNDKSHAVWTDEPTKILLDCYKELRPEVNGIRFKTLKHMWENIALRLQRRGFNFDHQQCESKWKTLIRSYRAGLNQSRKPRCSMGGNFDNEIRDILASCGITFEQQQQQQQQNNIRNINIDAHDNATDDETQLFPRKRRKRSESSENIQNLIQIINMRMEQKEKCELIKQKQRERLINAIEEHNSFMRLLLTQEKRS